jgi:GR25 family glycosyltransferase involved in LPS biosynthesis
MYCITCSASGRTERTASHFQQHGLDVTFVEGIQGSKWGLRTVLEANPEDGYIMSAGNVGCTLSHYMLWQALFLLGVEAALIFEDDVRLEVDFKKRLQRALGLLPEDWQMAYVGSFGTEFKPIQWARPPWARVLDPFGLHCYLVRRSVLPILLETNREARTHIDIQIIENSFPRLSYYVCWPSLAGQHSGEGNWPHTTGDNLLPFPGENRAPAVP